MVPKKTNDLKGKNLYVKIILEKVKIFYNIQNKKFQIGLSQDLNNLHKKNKSKKLFVLDRKKFSSLFFEMF